MVLTVQHLIDLIDALPKNEPFDYVIPGENKVVVVATSEDSIKMDKLKSDGSRKSCGMSKDILECIVDNVQEGIPFSVDSIFNGSGSGRSAWEAVLAYTTEFYKCKVGRQKHLIWLPAEPHKLGITQDYNGTIVNSDSFSPENVKQMFAFFLERCCKTSHRTDKNPLYLSGNAPVSYMSFLEPEKLFDYHPHKWSHIRSLYEITNHHEAEKIFTQLLADSDFVKRDTENNQGWRSGAIGYYVCFLNALNHFSKVINKDEKIAILNNQPLQLISSDDPTQFVWSCIKLFNERQNLKQLLDSKYKSLGGSIGNYIRINECYVAQIGKSDIKEIESIQIYDGSFLNAGFDARDIERFKDAVNDVFKGKYKIEIEQQGSQTIYKLIQLQINPDYRPYITAIKSKPFLLLAGISGTGKSRIVRELARACWDADSEEFKAHKPSNFEMVQVKPNWHDSSELIGYVSRVSGEPVYVAGSFLKFVAKAWENPDIPYFLCLDEMNLAPVEQYFAEYLSVVESRKAEDGVIKTDPILPKNKEDWYRILTAELTMNDALREQFLVDGICIPQNLIVVGTVNMDETTFSFSRKVLDRAMTIEMNEVNLICGLDKRHETIGKLDKSHLIGTAVEGCDVYNAYKADCDTAITYLNAVNQHLEKTPFKVAYRTRNEFLLYVVNNLPYNKDKDGKDVQHGWLLARALDEITCMKVLSRIEGDETKVSKEFLSELTKEIKTQLEKLSGCTYTADRAEENKESNVWYSRSLDKLDEMTKRLESGYTSFWS